MFCPFSSGAPPRANVTQTEQQQPLNLKHLSEAVRTLTSPPVSTHTTATDTLCDVTLRDAKGRGKNGRRAKTLVRYHTRVVIIIRIVAALRRVI